MNNHKLIIADNDNDIDTADDYNDDDDDDDDDHDDDVKETSHDINYFSGV